jgi:WD40 repeat protein
LLATGGDHNDQTIHLWDSVLGTHARTLRGHTWGIYSLAFSADGRFLASGSGDRTTRIWDVQAGHQLLILREHSVVEGITFSDEGYQVVTHAGNVARTWDLEHVLPTFANAYDSESEVRIVEDPTTSISEVYKKPPGHMGGVSDGFFCGMVGDRWICMAAPSHPSDYRRVTFISQEYRICGFAFQHDRVAFVCVDGQVLLLDISRLKREFLADA